MGKVADPLREYAAWLHDRRAIDKEESMSICEIADEIDREHERRMEQQAYELRRAFCRYIGGVVDDYKRGHKRESWLSQQRTQLELEVLRLKEAKHEDH